MLFYICIYIFAFFFIFLYSKVKNKYIAFSFKLISFLILFFPISLRYNIGTDYANYIWSITSGNYEEFEIGWVLLINFILSLNLPLQYFFIIPAFFSLFIIFNFSKKEYSYKIIIVYTLTMYIASYNIVRQQFATSILLLAIMSFLKKQRIHMIIWIVISCMFHKSMIIVGLVIIFCEIEFKILTPKNNFIFICLILGISFIDFGNIIINYIVPYTSYALYESSNYINAKAKIRTGLGEFIILFICIIFLISPKQQETEFQKRLYNLSSILIFCYILFQILYFDVYIFYRIRHIFTISFIIATLRLCLMKTKQTIILLNFILLLFILLSLSSLYHGSHGVIPYRSIL